MTETVLTIPAQLDRLAIETPDDPAMSWLDAGTVNRRTWAQHRDAVRNVAAAYLHYGVQPGDCVAIFAPTLPEHMTADLAASHIGAASTSFYPTLADAQLAHIIGDAEPRLIVVDTLAAASRLRSVVNAEDLRSPVFVIIEPGPPSSEGIRWSEFIATGESVRGQAESEIERRVAATDPDEPLLYVYTSGTTDAPKGVILTHRNVDFAISGHIASGVLDYPYLNVSHLPLAHIAERVMSLYVPLRVGGHTFLCADQSQLLPSLQIHRPTFFMSVPRVFDKLRAGFDAAIGSEALARTAEQIACERETLSRQWQLERRGEPVPRALRIAAVDAREGAVRTVRAKFGFDRLQFGAVGAAPVNDATIEYFAGFGIPLMHGYGLTESMGYSTVQRSGEPYSGAVGRPFPGVEAKLAEDGELMLRSEANSPGYRNLPSATSALFTADGWLRTGDVARIDEEGRVTIVDRKKELIVTAAGKNVAPSGIESLISGRSFISQAVVFGDRRPYLVAILTVDASALRAFASANGIDTDRPLSELVEDEAVQTHVADLVDSANTQVSRPEQIKRFTVTADDWTPATGEVTPTLKLRRRFISQSYQSVIDSLYTSTPTQHAATTGSSAETRSTNGAPDEH